MARSERIDYPGAVHHIMNRGACRAPIFDTPSARNIFTRRLSVLPSRFGIELQAYVVMPNHYHLLVRCPSGGLSEAMKWLGQTVTQDLNRQPRLDGPLFRGRFRNRVVGSTPYHAHLFAYLHLNPVPRLAAQPEAWPWSSARALQGRCPSWLSDAGMRTCFGGPRGMAVYTEDVLHERIQGPETFQAEMLWEGPATGFAERVRPESISRCVHSLTEGNADGQIPRTLEAAALVVMGGLSQAEAGRRLRMSRSTVGRAVGKLGGELEPNRPLRQQLDAMIQRL